jgi:hypothetical protein
MAISCKLLHDPIIPFPGIKRNQSIYLQEENRMFTVALFIKVPNWEWPRSPAMGKSLNSPWHSKAMEHS